MNHSAVNHPLAYRPEIDGLRAIAILLVIFFHFFPDWVPGGFVGVDVFFVISGYLITSLIMQRSLRGEFTIASFYHARICRLFPALLLMILVSVIWGWLFLLPVDYSRLGRHIASTMGFFENFTLKRESGYFDADIKLKPLAHMWSLSIEEQFYLVFPLLIIAVRAQWHQSRLWVSSLWILSLIASVWGVYAQPISAYFLPWMRAWELLSGAFLFFVPVARLIAPSAVRFILSIVGLTLIIASAFILDSTKPFPGPFALPAVMGASLLIWMGPDSLLTRWILANRLMTGVGLISYPLYLWHWPLLSFLHLWPGYEKNDSAIVGVAALSLVLSISTYYGLEKPLKAYRHHPALLRILVISAVLIAIAGIAISRTKGIPSRYPELPLELTIEKPPFPKEWRFSHCFLLDHQTYTDFAPECFSPERPTPAAREPKRRILLWGDSYAAQLYPGLNAVWKDNAEITQLTAMACPPVIGYSVREYPHCQEITAFVIAYLKKHDFDTVILAANWDGILKHDRHELFESTLEQLRKDGIQNLVIYGPPPLWKKHLPKVMLEHYLKSEDKNLPVRNQEALDGRTSRNESWLRGLAKSHQIGYVSIFNTLCSISEGCLVIIDQHFTSMDDGHLTEPASRKVFSSILNLNGDPN